MAIPADELRAPSGAEAVPPARPRVGAKASVTALLSTGFRSLTDLAGHVAELAALEARAAGMALVTAAAFVLGAALLVLTVWGLLIAAAVSAIAAAGLDWPWALLIVALINAVLAGALLLFVPRLLRRVSFSGTRRALQRGKV